MKSKNYTKELNLLSLISINIDIPSRLNNNLKLFPKKMNIKFMNNEEFGPKFRNIHSHKYLEK